jgi:hypothetical protein
MTSTIKVDNIQDQDGNNIINENANTITIGASGDTVTLASGASQTGFGRTGTVDWDTTAKTASFTAVSGNGYFVNTTSGALTVMLPASPSAGDIVAVADYAGTAATNNIIIARNGSNIEGGTDDARIYENRDAITLVYVDGTQGWVPVNNNEKTSILPPAYVAATGGTITTCGDFKIHSFTGPGTFTVSCAGNSAGSNTVDYLVVAGGGGGGGSQAGAGNSKGGAGAGGFRFSADTYCEPSPVSPLAATSLPVSAQGYPITVGGGGTGGSCNGNGGPGANSVFSSITSAGGGQGGGGGGEGGASGGSGGSNSSGNGGETLNAGNTPPVSPPQGNPSGKMGDETGNAGGGGGAGAVGANGNPMPTSVDGNSSGGSGIDLNITGSPVVRGGGGGGGAGPGGSGWTGAAGPGGGGAGGSCNVAGSSATANTGGGGGGAGGNGPGKNGGAGGSGIVIIRYKFQ